MIKIGDTLHDGGMPKPGKVTRVTTKGFWVDKYFFKWPGEYYEGFNVVRYI